MSADQLLFDMASAPTDSANVFVKKDYFSVLDDQNGRYQGNQSILQLSSLANSNRYMDYKNSYITVPMLLTLSSDAVNTTFLPATDASAPFTMGLKAWFGHVIHSVQVDYNNSTAQQLTSFQSLINVFKLHTTMSKDQIAVLGSSIGYYPDSSTTWGYSTASGLQNNNNALLANTANGNNQATGNKGLFKRQQSIAYDPTAITRVDNGAGSAFSVLQSVANTQALYRNYVISAQDSTAGLRGVLQTAVIGKIFSRHISDFLAKIPLVKGSFIKLTLNLNQPVVSFSTDANNVISQTAVNSPLGGVNPIMMSAPADGTSSVVASLAYTASLAVGATAPTSANHPTSIITSPLANSVEFHCPALQFAPVFETAYLSAPVKRFSYSDFYNYNIINRTGRITELITNGVANQEKFVVVPFLSGASNGTEAVPPIQSCLTTDGATTSPVQLNDLNILLSGATVLQQNYRYSYEMFLEQMLGCGGVNGGMIDEVSSGIIDEVAFNNNYAYSVVDTSRMLDVEKSVPKSLQLNCNIQSSALAVDLYTFILYKNDFAVDCLTGARVE